MKKTPGSVPSARTYVAMFLGTQVGAIVGALLYHWATR